jgi:GntR family transcriptional regulator/MocR family aminotransferase
MRDALYHLERSKPATLQAQIREILMAAIAAGQLLPGEPVPSTRAMARRLAVSRNTVTLAYQALVAEGFLVARERSGFYVDAQAVDGLTETPEEVRPVSGGAVDWAARVVKKMSAQRFIQRPRDWQKYPYPFIYGQVDHAIFPIAEWRDCVRQAMGKRWLDAWTVDQYTEDDPLLVEEIARRILPRRGIAAMPEQILITLGAQNALYLIAALLVDRGTRAVMENPGYPDLRNMLTLRSESIASLPVDDGGMAVDEGLAGADLVFCTPSHHFPTTVTMTMERRKALLAAARAYDFVVVEDDYEFETNYMGTPLPALKSLDEDGRVIHVGSLSKSLMPGLRLGYVVADARLIAELRTLRRLMLRHPPGNNQRAAALFMANGHYDVLVRRIHRVYRERWQAMAAALAEHLPGWATSPGFGGSSYWLTGPEGFDSERLMERALDHGVLIEPGTPFYIDPEEGRRRFRLGFSSIPAERVGEGIRRLRMAIDGMRRERGAA